MTYKAMAIGAKNMGKMQEMMEYMQKCHFLTTKIFGTNSTETIQSLEELYNVLAELGAMEQAL